MWKQEEIDCLLRGVAVVMLVVVDVVVIAK
jgi:hypothetical protein